MKKTSKPTLLIAATALIALPLASIAATETVTPVNTVGPTDLSGMVSFNDIPAFNSSLGTLIGVEFTLDLQGTPYLDVYNDNDGSEDFTAAYARERGKITLNVPTGTTPENVVVLSTPAYIQNVSGTVAGGSMDSIVGPGTNVSSTITVNDPAAIYTGTGTYDLSAYFQEFASIAGGSANPGVSFGGEDDLFASLSVEYFYDASVPEPTTWALGLFSIAALFLGRRFIARRA